MEHIAMHKPSKIQPSLLPKISDKLGYGNRDSAVYYYHGDHLGSASWITNKTGTPVQHLQYMPYGEPLVNEKTTSYEERYTFTGKERDSETGFSYFGARFYDSDILTGWLSLDPQSDKFPNISPYNYCNWNPVKLKDPDGEFPFVTNIVGAAISMFVEYGGQVVENLAEKGFVMDALTDVDFLDLGVAAVEGFVTSGTNIAKKAVVKTATEVGASIVSNTVDISASKGLEINDVADIGVGMVADGVGEIKAVNKKLHSPIPKSANKAVKEARAKKGSLPTEDAKQIVEKQRKKNNDKKTVYKMLEDQIQKQPSKVIGAMIKGVNEKLSD